MKSIVFALCIVLVSAVSTVAAGDPATEARAAIERANSNFSEAFARGDADALAAMYTTDAILFPPKEELLRGNAAIGQFWKKAHDGGVAVETGKVELTINAEGKPDLERPFGEVAVSPSGVGEHQRQRALEDPRGQERLLVSHLNASRGICHEISHASGDGGIWPN